MYSSKMPFQATFSCKRPAANITRVLVARDIRAMNNSQVPIQTVSLFKHLTANSTLMFVAISIISTMNSSHMTVQAVFLFKIHSANITFVFVATCYTMKSCQSQMIIQFAPPCKLPAANLALMHIGAMLWSRRRCDCLAQSM